MNSRDLMLLAMVRKGGSGGGSTSWNDLKDKPFYAEVHSVTYDVDNIDGATIFINQIPVVKISDNVIPVDSLANVTMTTENGTFTDIKWDGEYPIVGKQIVFIVYEDNAVYSDVTFPKKGIYLMPDVTLTWTETKPLDTKYLPEALQFGEEETEVTYDCGADSNVTLERFPMYKPGDTVNVTVDGEEYSLVAFDDDGNVTVGDYYDEIINNKGQYGWQIYHDPYFTYFFSLEQHTITYNTVTVKPLDEKYIPNITVVNFSFDEEGNIKSDKTFNDVINSFNKGKLVVGKCFGMTFNLVGTESNDLGVDTLLFQYVCVNNMDLTLRVLGVMFPASNELVFNENIFTLSKAE